MHQKFILIMSGILVFSSYSNAQTIGEKIDKHAKDPKTKENAAKADVYIVEQKVIADSSATSCEARKEARKERKAENRRARKNGNQ
jgi:hypothetical protein